MSKVRVGIVGAAGYTGGELTRLLLAHPKVELCYASSRSQKDKFLHEVHADLIGQTELKFTDELFTDVEVVFICLPHGQSKQYLSKVNYNARTKIIDLSNEFRLKDTSEGYIYGLPELNRSAIEQADKIANPGCFATAIQLALLPLAKANLLVQDVHVSAITGSTGAGVKLLPTTHFSWRNNNLSVYKVFKHQHLGEIYQSAKQLQLNYDKKVNFIPYRGDFTRGIIANVYTDFNGSEAEAQDLYKNYYKEAAFTHVLDQNVHLKQVVNTNNCFLQVQVIEGKVLITSVIDNLLKGASGQAVQNLNLMMGWEERTGLNLKAGVF